jgi:hypothetical protein
MVAPGGESGVAENNHIAKKTRFHCVIPMNTRSIKIAAALIAVVVAVSTFVFYVFKVRPGQKQSHLQYSEYYEKQRLKLPTNSVEISEPAVASLITSNLRQSSNSVECSPEQLATLQQAVTRFLKIYQDADFEAAWQFRNEPGSAHVKEMPWMDNPNNPETQDILREGLTIPADPKGRVKVVWQMAHRRKYRSEFWEKYLAERAAKKDPLPTSTSNADLDKLMASLFPKYLESLQTGGNEYQPYRFVAISPKVFNVTITGLGKAPNLGVANRSVLPGPQLESSGHIRYDTTIETIAAKNKGVCTVATISTAIYTNASGSAVPMTVAFYWDPESNQWLFQGVASLAASPIEVII